MLLAIPGVLTKAEVARCREALASADWVDGAETAGSQSRRVKRNAQVREGSRVAVELGDLILDRLAASPLFVSAALPLKTFPPLFNRYGVSDGFGTHVDDAIRRVPGTPVRVRTDLSCTLFLCEPGDYDGGELMVNDTYGVHGVKLPAGDMIVYPASSVHKVEPVTRGSRVCSFFWVQSMVRDDGRRAMLLELDQTIVRLRARLGDTDETVSLAGHYHNLLRMWSEI